MRIGLYCNDFECRIRKIIWYWSIVGRGPARVAAVNEKGIPCVLSTRVGLCLPDFMPQHSCTTAQGPCK